MTAPFVHRVLLRKLAAFGVAALVAAPLGGCRQLGRLLSLRSKAETPADAGKAASPATGMPPTQAPLPPPAAAPASGTERPLTFADLEEESTEALDRLPNLFSPSGRFVGYRSEQDVFAKADAYACRIYSLRTGRYAGTLSQKDCASFVRGRRLYGEAYQDLLTRGASLIEHPAAGSMDSPDGRRIARWKDATLTLATKQAGNAADPKQEATYAPPCGTAPCPPIATAAWSPDARLVAIAHRGESRLLVLDARDAHVVHTLQLGEDDALLGDMLAFSPNRVVALAGLRIPDGSDDAAIERLEAARNQSGRKLVQLVLFDLGEAAKPATPRRIDPPRVDFDLGFGYILDPFGRILLTEGRGDRGSFELSSLDLATLEPGPFTARGSIGDNDDIHVKPPSAEEGADRTVTLREGHWIPGPFPIWETQEDSEILINETTRKTAVRAWRIYTGPDPSRVRSAVVEVKETTRAGESGEGPACQPRSVKPDGRTLIKASATEPYDSCKSSPIDPSGRFEGVGKQELKRKSDGAVLTILEDGCATTPDKLYSCLHSARDRHFVYMPALEKDERLRADQLLPILYRPNLIADFLAGRPLGSPSPGLVIAEAPSLLVISAALRGPPATAVLSLRVTGGQPVKRSLRAFQKEREVSPAYPLPASGEEPLRVELPLRIELAKGACSEIDLYVCDAIGNVCSQSEAIRLCAPAPSAP